MSFELANPNENSLAAPGNTQCPVFMSDLSGRYLEQIDPEVWVSLTTSFLRYPNKESANTKRMWRSVWKKFYLWAQSKHLKALPASVDTIDTWITHLTTEINPDTGMALSIDTIAIYISTIGSIHNKARVFNPCSDIEITDRLADLRKSNRYIGQQACQAIPIRITGSDDNGRIVLYDKLLRACGNNLAGKRDRILLMMAMLTGCRRSELAAIKPFHIELLDSGAGALLIPLSKTDQIGKGYMRHLPEQFMQKYASWRFEVLSKYRAATIEIEDENIPVFPTLSKNGGFRLTARATEGIKDHQIPRIFKKLAFRAGYSTDIIERISGHSTRIGLAQELCLQKHSTLSIRQAMGWESEEAVLKYIRHLLTETNAAATTFTSIL